MHKSRIRSALILLAVVILIVTFILYLSKSINKQIKDSGTALVKQTIQKQVNITCSKIMQNLGTYGDLVDERYEDTQLTALYVQSNNVSKLMADVLTQCQKNLELYSQLNLQVPRMALIGSTYFADRGGLSTFQMTVDYTHQCEYLVYHSSVGINQIRYAIYLKITTDAFVVVPKVVQNVQYISYVPICEQTYNAKIPDVYVNSPDGTNFLDLLP